MLKYDNTVSSTIDGKPIYGAQVSVFTAEDPNNPALASLFADEAGTVALSQPILTDQLGYFAFYIPDGKYDIRVMTGVVEISRTNITMVDTLSLKNRALVVPQNEDSGTLPPAGERAGKLLAFDNAGLPQMAVPNSFEGPAGPANSTYTTLAGLKAAAVTNASYIFAPPSGSDGGAAAGTFLYQTAGAPYTADGVNVVKLDDVPLSTGALVRQGADSIVAKIPASAAILRPVGEKLAETVSVLDFIPKQYHASIRDRSVTADLSQWVNAGFQYVDDLPTGGTLYFPAGDYPCQIDASNADPDKFYQAVRILGDDWLSTRIVEPVDNAILLNMLGRNTMTVEKLHFRSGDRFASQVGIYLCRSAASTNCNNNRFLGIRVDGNFSRSAVVSIGAESSRWENTWLRNNNPSASHRTFWTGTNPANFPVTLPAGLSNPVIGPNTDNRMMAVEHHCPFDGARPVVFSSQAGWTMTNCTIIVGGDPFGAGSNNVRFASYTDPVGDIFNGPVIWENPHFEGFGAANVCHFMDGGAGVKYFNGISSRGGNYVVNNNTAILDYDRRTTAQPILQCSDWVAPTVPAGTTGNNFYAYAIVSSRIFFRPTPETGLVVVPGFVQNSQIEAGELRATNLADSSTYRVPAPIVSGSGAMPVQGTYGRGTVAFNPRPTVGQPTGWICTVSGTLGTLGDVTATTTAGSQLVTVTGANVANLAEGTQINIAGATNGPFIVNALGATGQIYVDKPAANSVTGAASYVPATFVAQANL